MRLEQIYLPCLAQASYFLCDQTSRSAVVVDPRRDVDVYLERAAALGARIERVVLTHFHADFLAGHLELAERCGADVLLGAAAAADFPFVPLEEGDEIVLGPELRLEVLATPGHTPEGITLLVFDRRSDDVHPHAALTGDCLFVGDVGRPDLMASQGWTAVELATALHESLTTKIAPLPDATRIYPAHGPGSMCGRNLGPETWSTMGVQRATNWALQEMPLEAFVRRLTADRTPAPAYFAHDADLNRRRRGTLEAALAGVRPLALERVLELAAGGAVLIDTRGADAHARGHLAGALAIGLDGQFATWCGTLVAPDRDVVLIAAPGRERESALRLGRIGYDRVLGHLDPADLQRAAASPSWRAGAREDLDVWATRVGALDALVLDVRNESEAAEGRIPGSTCIPLRELATRAGALPRDRTIAVHCRSGYRSAIAASVLEGLAFASPIDLRGGFLAWEASGREVERAS